MSSAAGCELHRLLGNIMRTFYTSGLFSVTKTCSILSFPAIPKNVILGENRKHNSDAFQSYVNTLTELGLSASKASLDRIIKKLEMKDCKYSDISDLCLDFTNRLIDETEDKLFLQ